MTDRKSAQHQIMTDKLLALKPGQFICGTWDVYCIGEVMKLGRTVEVAWLLADGKYNVMSRSKKAVSAWVEKGRARPASPLEVLLFWREPGA